MAGLETDVETTASPTVLVVEDDAAVRRMVRMALEQAGFRVALAETGSAALRTLDHNGIDAVVLDLNLPDGKAHALLDRLRREGALPWLVISAMDFTDATRRYGRFHGHFIAKPFDPWVLVRRLEEMLARS